MKISLQPMSKTDADKFLELSIQDYAQALSKAYDLTIEKAKERSQTEIQKILDNKENETNIVSIFDELKHESVGGIWFALYPKKKKVWICQIIIDENKRGNGFGKIAIEKLHKLLKEKEIVEVGLNVFGFNEIAFKLYQKTGYEIVNIIMKKDLLKP